MRTVLVGFAAAAVMLVAVRTAAVLAFADRRPELAARFWPDHPRVATELALAEIGRAAAAGRAPDGATLREAREVGRRDPLAAEPFLIEGTAALSTGRASRAEKLLAEAVARDPRLPAARFLLADLYVRQGRTSEGLKQIAALVRRLPRSAAPLTPSVAAFARQPGAAPQVRVLLAGNPELRGNVLSILAEDPANAQLLLELAGPDQTPGRTEDWQARILAGLLEAGDYRRAYQLWTRFSGLAPASDPMLFNPAVARINAPPPFNWTLNSNAAGVAEPAAGGGLHVLYYGREDAALASQVLVLKPGTYRLGYQLNREAVGATNLTWVITCLRGHRVLARQPLRRDAELTFNVPPSCDAQELQLRGLPADTPVNSDAVLSRLALTRRAGR